MRDWLVPHEWTVSGVSTAKEGLVDRTLPISPMRRQPLRKSGGFLQIDNFFAEIDSKNLSGSE